MCIISCYIEFYVGFRLQSIIFIKAEYCSREYGCIWMNLYTTVLMDKIVRILKVNQNINRKIDISYTV